MKPDRTVKDWAYDIHFVHDDPTIQARAEKTIRAAMEDMRERCLAEVPEWNHSIINRIRSLEIK